MVDTTGMTGMIILAFLALLAIYILLRFFKVDTVHDNDEEESVESVLEEKPVVRSLRPASMTDEEFMDFYTGPMLEDGLESLMSGLESARSGLHFYDQNNWEVASGDFHTAVKKIDEASNRYKEVPGIVEDESLKPVVAAKARIEQCRRLRALTIRMEEASDAMAEGKEAEAKQHAMVKNELEQMITGFKDDN